VRHGDGACAILRRELASDSERELAACSPRAAGLLTGSPSGTALYWSDLHDAGPVRHAIRSLDLAAGTTRWVTFPSDEREDRYPAISPDGRWLAFSRAVPGAPGEILRLELPAGAPLRVRAETCVVHGLTWQNGDQLIVSRACGGQEPGLWQVDVAGGPAKPLEVGGDRRSPAVAPSLGGVMFESWRERANLVVTPLTADGDLSAARPLAPSTRRDHSPALSPDGQRLVFVSDRTGVAQLWSVDVDGSRLVRLTGVDGAFPSRPIWSPDGKQIAFTLWRDGASDLCLVGREGGEPRCIDDPSGLDVAPIFDATGEHLIYGSDRQPERRWRIWRRPVAGGEPVAVTEHGVWPIRELDGRLYYMDFRTDGLRRRDPDGSDVLVHPEPPYGLASAVTVEPSRLRFARIDGGIVECTLAGRSCREVGRLLGLHLRSGLILRGNPLEAIYARHDKPDVEILGVALASPAAPAP
jgi:WD40 repeat protein